MHINKWTYFSGRRTVTRIEIQLGPQITNVAHIVLEGWKALEASTYVRLVQDFNQARDKDGCRWESLSTSKQYLITYLYRHLRELYLYTNDYPQV